MKNMVSSLPQKAWYVKLSLCISLSTVHGKKCSGTKYPLYQGGLSRIEGLGLVEARRVPPQRIQSVGDCRLLLPAGTGSFTLTRALNLAFNTTYWEHDHKARISSHADCYLMTLRDPAARLESGWRDSLRPRAMKEVLGNYGYIHYGQDINQYLLLFHHEHNISKLKKMQRIHRITKAARKDYAQSLVATKHHGFAPFQIAQTEYIRNFKPTHQRIYFFCLEHLAADWTAFLRYTRGVSLQHDDLKHSILPHSHFRKKKDVDTNATLTDEHIAFVRDCLYPWDSHLHDAVCNNKTRRSFFFQPHSSE